MHGESLEAIEQTCTTLNQRLKSLASGTELRVSTSELSNESVPERYTISGVVGMGGSAPELLEMVAMLRIAGAVHINITPLTYRFAEESLSVRSLRERLKRI
jgi:ATP phosphoribosyltransferase